MAGDRGFPDLNARSGRVKSHRGQRAADIVLIEPVTMTGFSEKSLDEATWPDFAQLVERHNGVWGGCWCMSFHAEGIGRARSPAQNRIDKECRVREGRA